MACPYFMPVERTDAELWQFRHRLPLGDGFGGYCTVAGYEAVELSTYELKEFCNMGYACGCPRLPGDRKADGVRFAVASDCETRISLHFVCERDHLPVEHGQLEFDCIAATWPAAHSDARIQKMADCYVQTYMRRRARNSAQASAS